MISPKKPAKAGLLLLALPAFALLGSCATGGVDFSAPLVGMYSTVRVAEKDFEVVSPIFLTSVKRRTGSPFGISRSVEGSEVTYTDLVLAAARLGADDIIDVRIDVRVWGRTGFAGFLTGWNRTHLYTGSALAIRYID